MGVHRGNGRIRAGSRRYDVQSIQDNHHRMIDLMALGMGNQEIAKVMGMSPQRISQVRCSPIVRERLEGIQDYQTEDVKSINQRVGALSDDALDVIVDVMESNGNKPSDRLRAAEHILNMAGHQPVTRTEHAHAYVSLSDIQEMKNRYEAAVVDVSSVQVVESSA